HAEPSTRMKVADVMVVGAQLPHQIGHALHRSHKRLNAQNLGPYMHADACNLKPFATRRLRIELRCRLDGHTKLVFAQSGGDVRMSFSEDIGVDAQRHTSTSLQCCRAVD